MELHVEAQNNHHGNGHGHDGAGGTLGNTMRGLLHVASGAGLVLAVAFLFSRQGEGCAAKERRTRLGRLLSEIKSTTPESG